MKIIGFKKQQNMKTNLKFLEGCSLPSIQKVTKTLIILFIFLLSFVNINAQNEYRLFPYQNISENAERIYTTIGEKFTTIFNEKENTWIMESNQANTIDVLVIDSTGEVYEYKGLLKLEITYNEDNTINYVIIDKYAFVDGEVKGPYQLFLMDVRTVNIIGGL